MSAVAGPTDQTLLRQHAVHFAVASTTNDNVAAVERWQRRRDLTFRARTLRQPSWGCHILQLSSQTARMCGRKDDLVAVRILNDRRADLIGAGHLIGRNTLLLEVIELFIEIRDCERDR